MIANGSATLERKIALTRLSYPLIPEIPPKEWWNDEIVQKARSSLQKNDVLTILLTGRKKDVFYKRIVELCSGNGLNFHFCFLKESLSQSGRKHTSTLDFKLHVIFCLLQKYQNVTHVELYDDRQRHVGLFSDYLKEQQKDRTILSFGANFVFHDPSTVPSVDESVEKRLVFDLVDICNGRIKKWAKQNVLTPSDSTDLFEESNGEMSSYEGIKLKKKTKRRLSISQFRSEITLCECIEYSGIMLDDYSISLLRSKFPCPDGWVEKIHHMTVSLGVENDEMSAKLGGIGSKHTLKATHFGKIEGLVQAVKIDPEGLVSENPTMHITLYISDKSSSRMSNTITDWELLPEPILLFGTYKTKVAIGAQSEKIPPEKKKDVSIGELVKKHYPELEGKSIGAVVNEIKIWMAKTFIENANSNRAVIEYQIKSIDLNEILNKMI